MLQERIKSLSEEIISRVRELESALAGIAAAVDAAASGNGLPAGELPASVKQKKRRPAADDQVVPPIAGTKQCTGCGQVKPLDDFHRGPGRMGRAPRCRECTSADRLKKLGRLPKDPAEIQASRHVCEECHAKFTTANSLASHRRERHSAA